MTVENFFNQFFRLLGKAALFLVFIMMSAFVLYMKGMASAEEGSVWIFYTAVIGGLMSIIVFVDCLTKFQDLIKNMLGWEKILATLYDSPDGWQLTLLGFEKDGLPVKDALAFFEGKGHKGKVEQYHTHLIEEHKRLSARLSTFKFERNDRRSCEQDLDDLESTATWKAIMPNLRMDERLKGDPILAVRPGDSALSLA